MTFDNFQIRLLRAEDLEEYFRLIERNRPRLEDFFAGTVSKTKTLEDTKNFVAENIKRAEQKTYFPYLIVDTATQSFAGFIDIKNIDWKIPKAELGCYVDEKYAKQGISTKALQLLVEFCFRELGFKKLFLRTHESNHAARKLAENCGFEIEGRIRKDYRTTAGEIVDLLYYGRVPELKN